MATLAIPNTIANGDALDAVPVDGNFDAIQSHVNTELVNRDGSVAMTGALVLPGNPSTALQAAPKQYVDAHLPTAKFQRTTDITLTTSTSIAMAAVSFETESNDTDGWWSSGSNFTVPANGVYIITIEPTLNKLTDSSGQYAYLFYLQITPGTTGGSALIDRSFNSSSSGFYKASDPSAFRYSCFYVGYLRAGEVIHYDHGFSSSSGTSQTITLQELNMTITRVALV